MQLTLSDATGTTSSLSVDGPPGKLRAQVEDDGKSCAFSGEVESEDRSLVLTITTYADEVQGLLAGQAQAVTASEHDTRSIAVNAATIYITHGEGTYYATAGTLSFSALPAPKDKVHIDVDVTVTEFSSHATRHLVGHIDATFIGATRSGTAHACPAIPDVPGGLIF